ncbi:MAG: PTS sugar transporter subunit IIC [Myxococcaceae bacterium]|nr:PTS sugar transporter subunit IIC [Myxococcaceae bacterium]
MSDPSHVAADAPFARVRARLQRVGDFFLHQRHLAAVRDGVMGALPLVLVGSLFLLVAQPPSKILQDAVADWVPVLLVPYRMLGGLIAVYVTFAAAHSLAKSYGLDPLANGLLAMAAFLVAAFPTPGVTSVAAAPALPIARLGAGGMFAGLLIAIATVEITRFFVRRNLTIRLPPTAPEAVIRSFVALVPAVAVLVLTFAVVHLARLDLVHLLEAATRPLLVATGSLPAACAVVSVDSALWLLGVHATAALATLKPLWESMLVQNMEAAAHGAAVLPNIATQQFYIWFVWQGGSGMTLPLAVHLAFARSRQLRSLGRVALLPAVCNVNEPILFGIPVVMNPRLVIPFFLAPLAAAVTSYTAFHFDLVTRPYLETLWTLPAPLGAFFTTGGDWRAVVLQLFNFALGFGVYWPFVRRYDRDLVAREESGQPQPAGLSTSPAGA